MRRRARTETPAPRTSMSPSRLGLGIASVLAAFLLAAGSAWATAPTLETSFAGPEGGTAGHLAVNEKTGEIFVLDEPKDAVDRYTSAGVLIEEIEGSKTNAGEFYFGNEKSDKIAVDNSGGPGQGTVYVSVPKEGGHVFAFKLETGVYKELWEVSPGLKPTGLAVDKHGNPWFANFGQHLIFELDPSSGATVKEVETPGVEPEHIAFDSEDHMLAGYRDGSDLVEIDPTTGTSLGSGSTREPEDVAVDPTTNNRFVTTFGYVEILTPAWAQPSETPFFAETKVVAVNGAAGKLYTATGNEVYVWRIPGTAPVGVVKTGVGNGAVASAPAGIECGSMCNARFEEGDTVTLTAIPDPGSAVAGWTGCVYEPSPNECEVNVAQINEVTVDFARTVILTVNESGSGAVTSAPAGIDCGATCSASFLKGKKVTLTASPAAHNRVAWEGCASVPAIDECEVTVDAAMSVSAVFSPVMDSLTITHAGSGSGTVTCDGQQCAASYPEGSIVALAGSAAAGSSFAGFSGAGCSGATCSVTLGANASVTATFNAAPTGGGGGPAPTPIPKPKPVVKSAKCKRGYVRQKVHGRVRCVKAKAHGKSKKRARKHH